jgi:hypothetical protein
MRMLPRGALGSGIAEPRAGSEERASTTAAGKASLDRAVATLSGGRGLKRRPLTAKKRKARWPRSFQ